MLASTYLSQTYIPYKDRIKKESLPNRKSGMPTVDEEMARRQEIIEKSTIVYRKMFPTLPQNLSKIDDPRNPNKIKHKITTLFVYGILLFVYQVGTRRNANRTMTTPILRENMNMMFPELESLPLSRQNLSDRGRWLSEILSGL